jgi:transposase
MSPEAFREFRATGEAPATYLRDGRRGPAAKPTSGRPSGLSPSQKGQLVRLLVKGPLRAGYTTDLWTLVRIAKLIQQEFGIRCHPGHVWSC